MGDEPFDEVAFADGRFHSLDHCARVVTLNVSDWREKRFAIVFDDVILLEALAFGGETGDATISFDDPLISATAARLDEPAAGLFCFSILDPWSEEPVIRIVARSYTVNAID